LKGGLLVKKGTHPIFLDYHLLSYYTLPVPRIARIVGIGYPHHIIQEAITGNRYSLRMKIEGYIWSF